MENYKWLNLQLFAGEGAASGGEGASTGEGAAADGVGTAVDAGQQRLRELGVPEAIIQRRAKKAPVKLPEGAVTTSPKAAVQAPVQAAAAEAHEKHTEEIKNDAPARMSWDEIMSDPEYNRQMQSVVQSRLRGAKSSEETLEKMAPAMEVLARKYGQDPSKIDYDALAKAITDDNDYYESKALEMGVPVETAKKLDRDARDTERATRAEKDAREDRALREHFSRLQREAEKMKEIFPGFDLKKELKNPVFLRMTSPRVGVSVEDAYFATHRNEIQAASMQAAAQKTAEKLSADIRSGQRRPVENGASGQAPSVAKFDYRRASRAERDALKQRIYDAAARGEKLYPGQ